MRELRQLLLVVLGTCDGNIQGLSEGLIRQDIS